MNVGCIIPGKRILITVSKGTAHRFNAGCRSMYTCGALKQRNPTWRLLVARSGFQSPQTKPRLDRCSCIQSLPLHCGPFQQLLTGSCLDPQQPSLIKTSLHTRSLEKLALCFSCTLVILIHHFAFYSTKKVELQLEINVPTHLGLYWLLKCCYQEGTLSLCTVRTK